MEYRLDGHYGYGRLMRSSVPLIGMMVLISLYSIVDGLFVSNLVGTTAFAALNLIWPALGLVGALGLTAGYCGTLCTPMAANFNIMPAALLEVKNKYAIIKSQIPVAVIMLVIHIALMYFFAF